MIEQSDITAEETSHVAPCKVCFTVCCGFGNPWSPVTWSGTPFNLCTALRDAGRLHRAIDASALGGPIKRRLARSLAYLRYGFDPQYENGRIISRLRSGHVSRSLDSTDRHVLHLGNDHLPLSRYYPGQKHYLYIDATPHLVRTHSLQSGWQNAALCQQIEEDYRHSLDQMDHIFTIGGHVRDYLIGQHGFDARRVTAVGTGRGPIQPNCLPRCDDGRTILFVAKRQFKEKGGELLIEAFRLLRLKRPDVRLMVAGQESYLRQLGNIDGLVPFGRINLDELQCLFEQATIFAMPALFEPWGLVYLEALSCGIPVVGLRRNALEEITQNGRFGFLCDRAEPEALANVLYDALSDRERLIRMGTEGRDFCIAKFTWSNTVERMISAIDTTTASKKELDK